MRSNEFSSVNLICEQIKKVEKERQKVKKDLAHHEKEVKKLTKVFSELEISHAQLKDVQAALSGRPLRPGGWIGTEGQQQDALPDHDEGVNLSAEGSISGNYDPLLSGLSETPSSHGISGSTSNNAIITRKRQRETPDGTRSSMGTPNTPPKTPPGKVGPAPNEYVWPYSTIIKTAGAEWVEIRCDVCGVNASITRNRFFTGWAGMFRHLNSQHDTSDRSQSENPFDYVLRTCKYRDVPEFELEELKMGRAQIEKVTTPKDENAEAIEEDAVDEVMETVATPYITQSPEDLMYAGVPMDEKPHVQVQAWFHSDGTGEHSDCSVCDSAMMPGGTARICRLCGFGICQGCFIVRGLSAAHYVSPCSNSQGALEHFDVRQC